MALLANAHVPPPYKNPVWIPDSTDKCIKSNVPEGTRWGGTIRIMSTRFIGWLLACSLSLLSRSFFFRLAQSGTGHLFSRHSWECVAHNFIKKLQAVHFPEVLILQSRACLSNAFILIQSCLEQELSRHWQVWMRNLFRRCCISKRETVFEAEEDLGSSSPILTPGFSIWCSS